MNNRYYIINTNTLAILPYLDNCSIIYEVDKTVVINKKPNNIIKDNCIRNGSSLKGRLDSTVILTGNSYKAPILISEENNIIFFPTASPRLKTCSWISLNNINNYYFNELNKLSVINFCNNISVSINTSLNVINNQVYKASRLEYIIRKNKHNLC